MQLNFDKKIAEGFRSNSQRARVLTENWVENSIFCPNCGTTEIERHGNNKPVADFYCKNCLEEYELKSKRDFLGNKVLDGAFGTKINRLRSNNNPNLFLLSYDRNKLQVQNFLVIPKHFFIPKIIERRKPLSSTARRYGWVGSNILLNELPESGKIFYVKNREIAPRGNVLLKWKETLFLRGVKKFSAKGWLLDVMRGVEKLRRREFTLKDMYSFESELSKLHPNNRHIKEKIRQQLQVLRDKGYLKFTRRGRYRPV